MTIDRVREHCERLTDIEKRAAIEKFFTGFSPYLGYRSLAALARHKRVLVLNLNWDDGIESACRRMGVKCATADIHDSANAIGRKIYNFDNRVVCVHLHGAIGGELRIGLQETLKFDESKRNLLLKYFFCNPTVIVGASLREDTDMLSLLSDIAKQSQSRPKGIAPVWVLSRESRSHEADSAMLRMLQARNCDDHLIEDEAVDFDRAMLYLYTETANLPFDSYRKAHQLAGLPQIQDIVFPRPDILRPHLDAPTIVFKGEPGLGKTTVAHLLSFFFAATSPRPPVFGEESTAMRVSGPSQCASALAHSRPDEVMLLEEPFGPTDRFQQNPSFLRGIQDKRKADFERDGATGRILITTRASAWAAGVAKHQAGDSQRSLFDFDPLRNIAVVSDIADDWYEVEDLIAFLDHASDGGFAQLVQERVLNTPGRIRDALHAGTPQLVPSPETLLEKRVMFERLSRDKLVLLALLRLQQMAGQRHRWDTIAEQAGSESPTELINEVSPWVVTFAHDERAYARLRHSTDADAIDACLDNPHSGLLDDLRQLATRYPWIEEALYVRDAIQTVRAGDYASIRERLGRASLDDWSPTFIEEAGEAQILEHVAPPTDLWLLRDFTYELVRLWPVLRQSAHADQLLEHLLNDEQHQGLYAVTEAALYLQHLTHPEIWTRIEHSLWKRYRDRAAHAFELALIFDALLWQRSPDDRLHDAQWVERLLKVESDTRGAIAFSLTFHANGFAKYVGEDAALQITLRVLHEMKTADQALFFRRMSRWHFIHESRDRALLHRREQLSKEFADYLRRTVPDWHAPEREHRILMEAATQLASLDRAGTAFYLILAFRATRGEIELSRDLRHLLDSAADEDLDVISAVMNYDIPQPLLGTTIKYFEKSVNRDRLLDAFAHGLDIDDERLDWPRFDCCSDPFQVMRRLKVDWPSLTELNVPLDQRANFRRWAKAMSPRSDNLRDVIQLAIRGDLRLLERTAERLVRLETTPDAAVLQLFESATRFTDDVDGQASATPRAEFERRPEPPALVEVTHRLAKAMVTTNLVERRRLLDQILEETAGAGGEFRATRANALELSGRLHLRGESSNQRVDIAANHLREARTLLIDLGEHDAVRTVDEQLKSALWMQFMKRTAPPAFEKEMRPHPLEVWDATIAEYAIDSADKHYRVTNRRKPQENRWKRSLSRALDALRSKGRHHHATTKK